MKTPSIFDAILHGTAKLRSAGVESPRFEAEILLSHFLSCGRAALYAHSRDLCDPMIYQSYEKGIDRRSQREPMAYIIGHRAFMGLDLKVTPEVLIPRADTEVVVEAGLQWLKERAGVLNVLDLCTGSGAIGLAIKKERPETKLTLTDLSEAALSVARENAESLQLEVNFAQGDLFEAVPNQIFDCIISNPPYVPAAVIESLEPEVRCYEPILALAGGLDGFDLYHRIIMEASRYLKAGGLLLLEAGDGQGEQLIREMTDAGYENVIQTYDLIGMLRGVGGVLKKS